MSAKAKYQPVLDLGVELGIQNGDVQDNGATLSLKGTANTPYEKDVLWNKIKEIGGDAPADIQAEIEVANTDHYHVHEVVSGDTLGKIAKHYYGNPAKYTAIFEANTDQLSNPDMINVGQKLTIPML